MANNIPLRQQNHNLHFGGSAERASMFGFLPYRTPVGGTGVGFNAVPFSVGAGATTFGGTLVLAGYNRFMIVATTAIVMGLVVKHKNPWTQADVFTEAPIAGAFAAGVASCVVFGDGTANYNNRVWNLVAFGFNNATGGAGNVTDIQGLWCSSI